MLLSFCMTLSAVIILPCFHTAHGKGGSDSDPESSDIILHVMERGTVPHRRPEVSTPPNSKPWTSSRSKVRLDVTRSDVAECCSPPLRDRPRCRAGRRASRPLRKTWFLTSWALESCYRRIRTTTSLGCRPLLRKRAEPGDSEGTSAIQNLALFVWGVGSGCLHERDV